MRSATMRPMSTPWAILLTLLLLMGVLAGCSGSSDSSAGGEDAARDAQESADAGSIASAVAPQNEAQSDATEPGDALSGTPVQANRSVIRTAQLVVRVDTLNTSAARVRQAAVDAGGFVASETTGLGESAEPVIGGYGEVQGLPAARGESVIVVRVPQNRFESVLNGMAAVGEEESRSTSAQDVTGEVADLTSRTKSAQASVDRVRALLADAKDLKDVVLLESELTRRQADLEASQARLAALSGQAELSTITVVLRTDAAPTSSSNPFMRGLERGWEALSGSAAILITLIGGLLPFVMLALIIGAPLWWLRRRRIRSRGEAGPGPLPGSQSSAGPSPDDDKTPVGTGV